MAHLSELTGPNHGRVELSRDDLCRLFNRNVLLDLWPTIYTLIGRAVREVWEESFPELLAARVSV